MCGIGKDLGRNGDGIRRKLICLGDSLTFGAGVTRRDCWTFLVQRECGWTVVNRGISGDTTGGMLVRLQRDVLGPALEERRCGGDCRVLVMGGSNDIFFSGTDSQARGNMTAICHQLEAEGIFPGIGIPLPVDWSKAPEKWTGVVDFYQSAPRILAYNEWLRRFAASAGLVLVDFASDFLNVSGQVRHELFLDGIHPNLEGHREMARRLAKELDKIY